MFAMSSAPAYTSDALAARIYLRALTILPDIYGFTSEGLAVKSASASGLLVRVSAAQVASLFESPIEAPFLMMRESGDDDICEVAISDVIKVMRAMLLSRASVSMLIEQCGEDKLDAAQGMFAILVDGLENRLDTSAHQSAAHQPAWGLGQLNTLFRVAKTLTTEHMSLADGCVHRLATLALHYVDAVCLRTEGESTEASDISQHERWARWAEGIDTYNEPLLQARMLTSRAWPHEAREIAEFLGHMYSLAGSSVDARGAREVELGESP